MKALDSIIECFFNAQIQAVSLRCGFFHIAKSLKGSKNMKKKLKKSLACLLATLLIFSTVPMSALADEAAAPVTVETVVEEAAPDTEPDAEPTATPEASAKPSAEPTAEPSPEATEEPTESEVSAEPEATAEPTASPTPNPEDEISLLALGDEAVTRYRTVGINGNFSSNYLYDLGQYPLYDILLNGTSYPAYCLQHGKGRVNNGNLYCGFLRYVCAVYERRYTGAYHRL